MSVQTHQLIHVRQLIQQFRFRENTAVRPEHRLTNRKLEDPFLKIKNRALLRYILLFKSKIELFCGTNSNFALYCGFQRADQPREHRSLGCLFNNSFSGKMQLSDRNPV